MFEERDERTDNARGDPEDCEPEQGKANAVFRGYTIKGEECDKGSISCSKAVDRNRNGGDGRCDCKDKEQSEIRDMNVEQLCDQI